VLFRYFGSLKAIFKRVAIIINMKDILHFSHANGFPAGSYSTLLSYLSDDFDIGVIDRLGHNEEYPVTDNWSYLVRQLIDYFERTYAQPVFAVGHSLGGVLSMMVAAQRPDLVKGLIMLDAPFLTAFEAHGLTLVKRMGLMDKVTPSGRTLGRKEEWDSLDQVFQYFRSKRLFSAFDERCLNDYVQNGTQAHENGRRRLHFKAETEISIYRTIPNNLHHTKRLSMPAAAIAGNDSDVFKRYHGLKMQRQLGMGVSWVEGSHMFPLEKPEMTADAIRQYLLSWQEL
jgi:pimeloyl-ACP methyl ester carboxylesterase